MAIKLKHIAAIATILTLSSTSYAMGPGFYFGLGAGTTDVHAKSQTFLTPNGPTPTILVSPSTSGIGERMFLGYDINPYAGMEFGFSHYGPATYKIPSAYMVSCNNPSIRQNGFDMEGKGMLPLSKSGFSFYAKLGMAVVYAGSSGSLESNGSGNGNPCGSGTSSKAAARPLYGIGASYDFNQSWQSDLGWTHINGGGNVQTADFIAISFSYHLTDSYCGQFLC